MLDLPPLPTEDGHIDCSAAYGHTAIVRIDYTTNPDNSPADPGVANYTLHGPFADEAEAKRWIEAYPDGDTEIEDMVVQIINLVRPMPVVP